jgi:hypothetical protein
MVQGEEDEDGNIQYRRSIPQNDLDLNMLLTQPAWGTEEIIENIQNPELKRALRFMKPVNGRDTRLGNLDDRELISVRYYNELASDILTEAFKMQVQDIMYEPFVVALSKGAIITETSQAKKGFLRKINTTFTNINVKRGSDEPSKKSLFSGKEKGDF